MDAHLRVPLFHSIASALVLHGFSTVISTQVCRAAGPRTRRPGPREQCHGRDGRPAFNMVTCISTDYAVAAEGGEMRRLVAGSATAGIRGEGQLSSAGPMAT